MRQIRCLSILCLLVWALAAFGQEIEIHEEGTVVADMPSYPYGYYDPYFHIDPTSIGTGGSTDPGGTAGSGGSSDDVFQEECGTEDVYVEAKILNMTGGGFSITNPSRGLWGNNLTVYAKIHNVGSSKINKLSLDFKGPEGYQEEFWGPYQELQMSFTTPSGLSTDGNGRLTASGQIECMNVTRALSGQGNSEIKDILMFHQNQRFRTSGEHVVWGKKTPVFNKDYCIAVERKFTHAYAITVSYEGGFELSPVASASLGLSQSYTVSEETVHKFDKFDGVNAYYEEYQKSVYLEAFRYRADGVPGGTEATAVHVETGKQFKVDYFVLEACK